MEPDEKEEVLEPSTEQSPEEIAPEDAEKIAGGVFI
jgi:hypothetical protein